MTIAEQAFSDLYTFTRSGVATQINAAGELAIVPADTIRADFTAAGDPRGWLIEGPTSNVGSNPRFNGSPPSAPTNMTYTPSSPALSVAYAYGTEAGMPYVDVTISGTAAASGFAIIYPDSFSTAVSAAPATWTASIYARLVSGTFSGSFAWRLLDSLVSTLASVTIAPTSAPLLGQRFSVTGTHSNASATAVYTLLLVNGLVSGQSYNFTIRLGGYQIEQRTAMTSLTMPASGLGPVSRGRDVLRTKNVAWWNPSRTVASVAQGSTIMVEFVANQAAPASSDQGILRIDDGTADNRLELYIAAGTSAVRARRTIGGVTAAAMTLGNMTAGVACRVAYAVTPTREVGIITGGALVTATPGGVFAPARCMIGSITDDDTSPLNGYIRAILAYDTAQANVALLDVVDTEITIGTLLDEGGVLVGG